MLICQYFFVFPGSKEYAFYFQEILLATLSQIAMSHPFHVRRNTRDIANFYFYQIKI